MKNKIVLGFCVFFFSNLLFAQMSLNPSHEFYASTISWQNRGIVKNLPPIRPYTVSNIKEILQTVIENGTETDKEIAKAYWEELTGKAWHLELQAENIYKNQNSESSDYVNVMPSVNGDLAFFEDMLSLGYNLRFSIRTAFKPEDFYPEYTNYSSDARFDPGMIGPLYGMLDGKSLIALRKGGLILQAGISRNGYGDFLNEGLALNDSAFHRPNISISYVNDLLSYTQQLSMLGATTNTLYTTSEPRNSKYLAFHAFELKPFSWLSASFYETMVFGKRFDFAYMLPVPFMVAQSFSGYADSLMMGLRFKFTPVNALSISTDFLVDDMQFNELVKFNFNSKNRIAWNTGIEYTPEPKLLERISLNYLIVTPYTYTHWDVDDTVTNEMTATTINYQNYTNCGYTIGTTLPPNSHQLKVSVDFKPVKNLKISFYGAFMQHANITETLTVDEQLAYLLADEGVFCTDGSIYNHPYGQYAWDEESGTFIITNKYLPTAWNYMNFLTQAHKMIDVQAGLKASYELFNNKKFGSLSLNLSYVFEFIHNKGVDSEIFPGGTLEYNSETGSYKYNLADGSSYSTTDKNEVVNYYIDQWIAGFSDQWKSFITLSLEYRF